MSVLPKVKTGFSHPLSWPSLTFVYTHIFISDINKNDKYDDTYVYTLLCIDDLMR